MFFGNEIQRFIWWASSHSLRIPNFNDACNMLIGTNVPIYIP